MEKVIQRATRSSATKAPDKEKVTLVFKTATTLRNKKREEYVTISELTQALGKKITEKEL